MRELGAMETALALTDEFSPINVVSVVRLSDGPSPAALERALQAAQARHPWLRARLAGHGARRRFEPADAPLPLRVLDRAGDGAWQPVVEAELNQRLPAAAGPLARCTYLYTAAPGQPSEIVLTCHHAIVDGDSSQALWHELLTLAAAYTESTTPDLPPPAPPGPASDALLPAAFHGWRRPARVLRFIARQMADEAGYQWRTRRAHRPPLHASAQARILALPIPSPITAALVRRCRAERVTLNSALNAAILLAVHRHLYGRQATRLRGITFSNLRPYLKPPVPPEQLGCHIALLRYSVDMAAGQAFWPLAHAIHAQVADLARQGDKFAAALLAPLLVRATQRLQAFRLGAAALSYAGVVNLQANYGRSRVLGVHGFVSNHRLGPEYTATARLFGDELWWDIVYLNSDMDLATARALAGEVEHCLEAAGSV